MQPHPRPRKTLEEAPPLVPRHQPAVLIVNTGIRPGVDDSQLIANSHIEPRIMRRARLIYKRHPPPPADHLPVNFPADPKPGPPPLMHRIAIILDLRARRPITLKVLLLQNSLMPSNTPNPITLRGITFQDNQQPLPRIRNIFHPPATPLDAGDKLAKLPPIRRQPLHGEIRIVVTVVLDRHCVIVIVIVAMLILQISTDQISAPPIRLHQSRHQRSPRPLRKKVPPFLQTRRTF